MGPSPLINGFLEQCNSCGKCKEACPFLSSYGTPKEIILDNSADVFLCANCRGCNSLCPQTLTPSEALLHFKHQLLKTGQLPEKTKSSIASANAFAMRGHKFPFTYYSKEETAFWPGCSLQGTRPDVVKKIIKILKVGLVLDCCFDPSFHNGDLDAVEAASERIKKRLKKHGIKHLILGCTNCKKIFSLYMPEIKTEHILEVLTETTSKPKHYFDLQDIYLHHPCPSYRFDLIRENANTRLAPFVTITAQPSRPLCCGLGGAAHALSEELSDQYTEKVISDAKGHPIVTYCMGCKNKYLKKGKDAYHILEFITDAKPLKQSVSSGRKWLNRLLLAMEQRLKTKRFLLGTVVIMAIIISTYLRKFGYISPESLFGFIQQYNVLAPALFILIYAVGPSIFIPSLPLTLGAGFLWGPLWGVIFSITGATIGASIPFLLARYIIGNTIKERFSYARWEWLKEKVERHGWKAVAFTRIVPIFPYPVLNYLFGITPIPFFHYLWSTLVFMLPACIAYVAFGSSMGELVLKGNIKGIITGILIASVAMILPVAFKPMLKKVLPSKNE
ncbi:MAG: VTT domain-containing protein [Nitrospirota bacterium]